MNDAANVSLTLRTLDTTSLDFEREFERLIAFEAAQDPQIDARVASIVADVRARGDAALLEYTAQFDRLQVTTASALEITPAAMQEAFDRLPSAQRGALQIAAQRVR